VCLERKRARLSPESVNSGSTLDHNSLIQTGMAQLAQAHSSSRPTSSSVAETEELLPTPPRTVSSESEPVDIAPPSRTDRIKLAAEAGDAAQLRDMANQAGGYETDELRRIVWSVSPCSFFLPSGDPCSR